jgi:hypothetical protein
MIRPLRTVLNHLKSAAQPEINELQSIIERQLVLLGQHSSRSFGSERLRHISDAEFRVFSQWGEDGILEWLIQRIPISSRRFVEFGVEDYREANTRFLLVNRNWRGMIMDGNPALADNIHSRPMGWRYDLTPVSAFIDRDNINSLIRNAGFSGDVGVLSIDIDGNDYWIWEAIDCVNADIVVCEYNAVFGDLQPITIPYRQNFFRTTAHYSNLYFGSSIAALILLAKGKGYEFVGSNRAGSNAFFVRTELFERIHPLLEHRSAFPSFCRESRSPDGKLTFLSGFERLKAIEEIPVLNVQTGIETEIRNAGRLYSAEWLHEMS